MFRGISTSGLSGEMMMGRMTMKVRRWEILGHVDVAEAGYIYAVKTTPAQERAMQTEQALTLE